jgi:hypothetical protein
MKKTLLLIAFLCFIQNLYASEPFKIGNWTYYPKENPKSKFNQSIRKMSIDNDILSIITVDGEFCYSSFNSKTGVFDSLKLSNVKKMGTVLDLNFDSEGNIWILQSSGLFVVEADSLRKVTAENFDGPDYYKYACFSKNQFTKELYLTLGWYVWKVKPEGLEEINLKDSGTNAYFFNNSTQGRMYFKENGVASFTSGKRDTLFYFDFKKMKPENIFSFKDLGIKEYYDQDSVFPLNPTRLKSSGYEDYLQLNYYNQPQYQISLLGHLYKITDNSKAEILSLEAPEGLEITAINDFSVTESGRIFAMVKYFQNDSLMPYYYFTEHTPEGKLVFSDRFPELPSDNLNTPGVVSRYTAVRSFLVIGEEIYFNSTNGTHCGILKYTPQSSGIESESAGEFKLVLLGVKSIYPNPTSSEARISFFCYTPIADKLEYSVYDYMGKEYENANIELINFDTSKGKGELKVDLSGMPPGPKYIMLKAGEETATAPIMVK